VRQYEIWWAELPQPAGRRPVLLLSRNSAYDLLNKFVAAEITGTIRHIPIEVLLGLGDGLPKECVANFDNLRTISKTHLVARIGRVPAHRIPEMKRALGYALEWDELIAAGE
jgi:mRNA interferase MazF